MPWLISTLWHFLKEWMERRRYKIKLQKLAPLINKIDVDMLSYKLELLINDFSQLETKLCNEHKSLKYIKELESLNINKYVKDNTDYYESRKKPKPNIRYMRWGRY